jgi:2-dehydro-3-deoxyphosphogluconate aldolase/(4S)-4-hydroxy-2-oxoglutarate aldolase
MTVTEAVTALEYGCSVLKLFPASACGPSILKAFAGPLPQARFIPTGGVSLQNAAEWIRAGAAAIGTGSELTSCGNDYASVAKNAERFLKAVSEARGGGSLAL